MEQLSAVEIYSQDCNILSTYGKHLETYTWKEGLLFVVSLQHRTLAIFCLAVCVLNLLFCCTRYNIWFNCEKTSFEDV